MNKMKIVLAGLSAMVLAAGCCQNCGKKAKRAKVTVEPGKVVAENRFDKGMNGWEFSNFMNLLSTQIVETAVSGKPPYHTFRIENKHTDPKKARDTMFFLKSGLFPVTPGAEFAIVTEARGSFTMEASTVKGGIATGILWYGADKKPILIQDPLGKKVPSGTPFGFKSLSPNFVKNVFTAKVPADAAFAMVQLGGDAPDVPVKGGYLELKRVTVRESVPGEAWDFGDLSAPEFELLTMTPNPDPNAVIRFQIVDESDLDMAKFKCTIDGKDVTQVLTREGDDVFSFKSDKPWEKDSLHLIAIEATDDCGNAGKETLAFFCGERFTKGIASVRDDGMILIDGKPFFPITPTSVRKGPPNGYNYDKAMSDLKAIGFNSIHSYDMYNERGYRKNSLELLEACEKAGMKLFVEASDRNYNDPKRAQNLREALLVARKYSCVLGWGLGDDTASHRTAVEVKGDHNIIKAIDNARLTWQVDISTYEGRQTPFVKATDAFMSEIYPFREEIPEPEGLANVIKYMKYAYADKKAAGDRPWPIIALPQAFSGWGLWKRFPTIAEIRAQSYLSIIHGARGVAYYSYYSFSGGANCFGHNEEQFNRMAAVSKELNSIQDDLASRDAKVQPKVKITNGAKTDLAGNPSVTCLLKEGAEGMGKLLIAGNSRTGKDDTIKVEIELDGNFETLFENGRKVEVKNGVLIDTFKPGEVHVYRVKK